MRPGSTQELLPAAPRQIEFETTGIDESNDIKLATTKEKVKNINPIKSPLLAPSQYQ